MYVAVDENGRITATTEFEEFAEGMSEFEFPEDFDFGSQSNYRIVDGELKLDPPPKSLEQQIVELKQKLSSTDSELVTMYESYILNPDLSEEESTKYKEFVQQRQEWRDELSELETKLKTETNL